MSSFVDAQFKGSVAKTLDGKYQQDLQREQPQAVAATHSKTVEQHKRAAAPRPPREKPI